MLRAWRGLMQGDTARREKVFRVFEDQKQWDRKGGDQWGAGRGGEPFFSQSQWHSRWEKAGARGAGGAPQGMHEMPHCPTAYDRARAAQRARGVWSMWGRPGLGSSLAKREGSTALAARSSSDRHAFADSRREAGERS